jgi:membrane-associated protein
MPLLPTATLALNPLDAHGLPAGVGALGVFAGTSLLMGFFLPGDSLLCTARFA